MVVEVMAPVWEIGLETAPVEGEEMEAHLAGLVWLEVEVEVLLVYQYSAG